VHVDAAADKIIGHAQEILEQDVLGGALGTMRRIVVCGIYHGVHFKLPGMGFVRDAFFLRGFFDMMPRNKRESSGV